MDDSSHPPIQPGGPGGGTGTGTEAGMISGTVCMADDLIIRATCLDQGVGGLTVALGDTFTTTAPDGSFTLPRPTVTPGSDPLAFTVSGHAIPEDRLNRDFTQPYERSAGVLEVFRTIYAEPDKLAVDTRTRGSRDHVRHSRDSLRACTHTSKAR